MIYVVMILRYLSELREGLECALLESPHFPVAVTSGDNLVIILRVECETTNARIRTLFREIIVSHHSLLNGALLLLIFGHFLLGLLANGFNPRVYEGLYVPVSVRVRGDKDTNVFRVLRKAQTQHKLLMRTESASMVM